MDIPTELKDWWIYLFPGCLFLIEILFLYDALVRVTPAWFGPGFEITSVWSYSEIQMALFLLGVVAFGLVIGSMFEGLSYRFFERFQKKSSIISSAFSDSISGKEDFAKQLLSDSKLFPKELWKGSFEAMKQNMEGVGEFIEIRMLQEATDEESESLNETALARTFTQSFFLSFTFFPSIFFWLFVRGYFGIAVLFGLLCVIYLAYLWKDQRGLTRIYWTKTFAMYVSHLWKTKKSVPPASPSTRSVEVAKTVKQACKLVESGFEYVTEIDGAKIFRKGK